MNNEVEHEALLRELAVAKGLGVKEVEVYVDSQVVVKQVRGEYLAKGEKLKKYLQQVWERCDHF